jgi:hypothetical protein
MELPLFEKEGPGESFREHSPNPSQACNYLYATM